MGCGVGVMRCGVGGEVGRERVWVERGGEAGGGGEGIHQPRSPLILFSSSGGGGCRRAAGHGGGERGGRHREMPAQVLLLLLLLLHVVLLPVHGQRDGGGHAAARRERMLIRRRTGGAEQRDAARRRMRRQGTRGGGGSYVAATMSAGAGVKSTNGIGRRASTTVAPCHVEKRDGTVEAAEAARRTPRAAAPDSVPTAVRRAAPLRAVHCRAARRATVDNRAELIRPRGGGVHVYCRRNMSGPDTNDAPSLECSSCTAG